MACHRELVVLVIQGAHLQLFMTARVQPRKVELKVARWEPHHSAPFPCPLPYEAYRVPGILGHTESCQSGSLLWDVASIFVFILNYFFTATAQNNSRWTTD